MAMFDSKKNLLIVGMAAAVAVSSFFIHIGPTSKLGLYEHVRKAGRYIKARKYTRGIYYLRKAYEEAPESKLMGEELAMGYLEYARHLNFMGDLDLAIEKVVAAYEIIPESLPVKNDLAYYLSVRAVEKSFSGSTSSAKKDLEIVNMLAEGSGIIRTNIANYLFNRAIDARDRKDTETLMFCLKASYDLRPRFDTIVFLGVSFYDMGDLENAVIYWREALLIKPDDADIRKNIEKTEKELLLQEHVEIINTPDFEIITYREGPAFPHTLEEHLVDVYNMVGKDLEYYPSPGTRIIVYDEKDFRDIFQKDGVIRGFYDGNIRIALVGELTEILYSGVMAHEYTHAALSAITENRCPIWLHEGVALYEQSRYTDISTMNLEAALKKGVRLNLTELERSFSDTDDYEALTLAYESAYMAVLFILDEWGLPGLRELLDGIKKEGHFANAFDEKFYTSVSTFEDMWNDFARKKLISDETRDNYENPGEDL